MTDPATTTDSATAAPVQLVARDIFEHPLSYAWRLTGLGLAVRAHLLKEPKND